MQKELELYEMLYLVTPSFSESELVTKMEFYRDFLTNRGSQVMVHNRGKRSLSYKIKGSETANYIQMIYVGNQKLKVTLDTEMSRDNAILRSLTTKIPKLPEVTY
jgi:ribosomal protein S6